MQGHALPVCTCVHVACSQCVPMWLAVRPLESVSVCPFLLQTSFVPCGLLLHSCTEQSPGAWSSTEWAWTVCAFCDFLYIHYVKLYSVYCTVNMLLFLYNYTNFSVLTIHVQNILIASASSCRSVGCTCGADHGALDFHIGQA